MPPGCLSGNPPVANASTAGGGAPTVACQRYFALLRSIPAILLLSLTAVRGDVIVSPVGDPVFQIADSHLFAAPTGPSAGQTVEALFPAHFPTRVVHQPPYIQELTEGLALNPGFPEGAVFDVSQFTFPSGVYLGFVLVPGPAAPTAPPSTSPAARSSLAASFRSLVRGDVFLNGALFEGGAFNFDINPTDTFDGTAILFAARLRGQLIRAAGPHRPDRRVRIPAHASRLGKQRIRRRGTVLIGPGTRHLDFARCRRRWPGRVRMAAAQVLFADGLTLKLRFGEARNETGC